MSIAGPLSMSALVGSSGSDQPQYLPGLAGNGRAQGVRRPGLWGGLGGGWNGAGGLCCRLTGAEAGFWGAIKGGWNISRTAGAIGVAREGLSRKIETLGIEVERG